MNKPQKPIEIDSKAWTGDIPEAGPQTTSEPTDYFNQMARSPITYSSSPFGAALGMLVAYIFTKKTDPGANLFKPAPVPPRSTGKHKTPAILLAGPLFLCVLAIALGIYLDTDFGNFGTDYLLSRPSWQEDFPRSFAIVALACMILLIASKFIRLPDWINRASAAIGLLLIALIGLDFHWTLEAHRSAYIAGPAEPLLIADGNNCGRKFSFFSKRGSPDPGPCIHGIRAMNRDGQMLWLTGRGMASERACILVRKVTDGHGSFWYRRIAYYDLLPEMGQTDFPRALGQQCFDGTLMKRFDPLLH